MARTRSPAQISESSRAYWCPAVEHPRVSGHAGRSIHDMLGHGGRSQQPMLATPVTPRPPPWRILSPHAFTATPTERARQLDGSPPQWSAVRLSVRSMLSAKPRRSSTGVPHVTFVSRRLQQLRSPDSYCAGLVLLPEASTMRS